MLQRATSAGRVYGQHHRSVTDAQLRRVLMCTLRVLRAVLRTVDLGELVVQRGELAHDLLRDGRAAGVGALMHEVVVLRGLLVEAEGRRGHHQHLRTHEGPEGVCVGARDLERGHGGPEGTSAPSGTIGCSAKFVGLKCV